MEDPADQDVAATNFIAHSKPLKEALKSAQILKSIPLNTLLTGGIGTGKHALAGYIFPEAPVVSVNDAQIYALIETEPRLIVDHFEQIRDFHRLFEQINVHGCKIIAITTDVPINKKISEFFSISIHLPPLQERPEDIMPLAKLFFQEANMLLFEQPRAFSKINTDTLDVSQNAISLRKSILLQLLTEDISQKALMDILERHLDRISKHETELYRSYLFLFEVPLIRFGMKRYKSQLKMADIFGLNRNTLRKKINQWKEYLS